MLSSIPPHAAELTSPGTDGLLRLPALFSVGVHDIPQLEELRASKTDDEELATPGWVACTTDEIIATKKKLYDIIVELPPTYDAPPQKRKWPIMKTSEGTQIKASQRDLWRYKMLHRELWRHRRSSSSSDPAPDGDDDRIALLPHGQDEEKDGLNETYDDSVVEPSTWTRLAYNGFMWWASAGEQHDYTSNERERDRDLLGDLSDYREGLPTAIIAYFHRSTTMLINNLNNLIERSDDEDGGGDDDDDYGAGVLLVDKDDLSRMGLDTWSESDKAFLTEFLWMWFGRICEVRGASVDCCGVRIPAF